MTSVRSEARVSLTDINSYVRIAWDGLRAKGGTPFPMDGVPGRKVKATLTEIMLRKMPALSALPRAQQDTVLGEIRSALKVSGNAKCLESKPGKVIWWVAENFSDTRVVMVMPPRRGIGEGGRQDPKAEAEARLTPHEAGEDRVPKPVEVKTIKHDPDSLDAKVLALLERFDEPLASIEIAFYFNDLQPTKSKHPNATKPVVGPSTKKVLERLANSGQITTRLETSAERAVRAGKEAGKVAQGRPGRLYFRRPGPVPSRKTRVLIQGYQLEVGDLNLRAGAEAGIRKAAERDEKALTAILNAGVPVTTNGVQAASGLSPSQTGEACRSLERQGVIHRGPMTRDGAYWLPVGEAFPRPKKKSKSKPKRTPSSSSPSKKETPVAQPSLGSPTFLAIFKAARDLATTTGSRDVTSADLAHETRYSSGTCSDILREHPEVFERTNRFRSRCVVYRYLGEIDAQPEPEPEYQVPTPPPLKVVTQAPPASESDSLREAVAVLAAAHGLVSSEDVEPLRARILELEAELARAKSQIRALTGL